MPTKHEDDRSLGSTASGDSIDPSSTPKDWRLSAAEEQTVLNFTSFRAIFAAAIGQL